MMFHEMIVNIRQKWKERKKRQKMQPSTNSHSPSKHKRLAGYIPWAVGCVCVCGGGGQEGEIFFYVSPMDVHLSVPFKIKPGRQSACKFPPPPPPCLSCN